MPLSSPTTAMSQSQLHRVSQRIVMYALADPVFVMEVYARIHCASLDNGSQCA